MLLLKSAETSCAGRGGGPPIRGTNQLRGGRQRDFGTSVAVAHSLPGDTHRGGRSDKALGVSAAWLLRVIGSNESTTGAGRRWCTARCRLVARVAAASGRVPRRRCGRYSRYSRYTRCSRCRSSRCRRRRRCSSSPPCKKTYRSCVALSPLLFMLHSGRSRV